MGMRMWRTSESLISVEGRRGYFDIAYDTKSEKQKLDIWLPEGEGPFPVIVSIHGGGFVACDKRSAEMINPMLEGLKRGYAVVGVNYRLTDEASFPDPCLDVKRALAFLVTHEKEYLLDTSRMVTWGGSAGGYLSLMAALTHKNEEFSCGIDAEINLLGCVAWYAATDFERADIQLASNEIIKKFMPATPEDVSESYSLAFPPSEAGSIPYFEGLEGIMTFVNCMEEKSVEKMRKASAYTYIYDGMPPIFLQHGSGDEIVPMQQSVTFAVEAGKYPGNDVRIEILPGAIHSSVLFETKENIEKVLDFIDEVTMKEV